MEGKKGAYIDYYPFQRGHTHYHSCFAGECFKPKAAKSLLVGLKAHGKLGTTVYRRTRDTIGQYTPQEVGCRCNGAVMPAIRFRLKTKPGWWKGSFPYRAWVSVGIYVKSRKFSVCDLGSPVKAPPSPCEKHGHSEEAQRPSARCSPHDVLSIKDEMPKNEILDFRNVRETLSNQYFEVRSERPLNHVIVYAFA